MDNVYNRGIGRLDAGLAGRYSSELEAVINETEDGEKVMTWLSNNAKEPRLRELAAIIAPGLKGVSISMLDDAFAQGRAYPQVINREYTVRRNFETGELEDHYIYEPEGPGQYTESAAKYLVNPHHDPLDEIEDHYYVGGAFGMGKATGKQVASANDYGQPIPMITISSTTDNNPKESTVVHEALHAFLANNGGNLDQLNVNEALKDPSGIAQQQMANMLGVVRQIYFETKRAVNTRGRSYESYVKGGGQGGDLVEAANIGMDSPSHILITALTNPSVRELLKGHEIDSPFKIQKEGGSGMFFTRDTPTKRPKGKNMSVLHYIDTFGPEMLKDILFFCFT